MLLRIMLSALCVVSAECQVMVMGEASEGFVSLFNGQDLDQWNADPQIWKVARGVINGSTDESVKAASLLTYKGAAVRDFDLRFEVRVQSGETGIEVRGHERRIPLGTRPNEWTEYSIYCKAGLVRVTREGAAAEEWHDKDPKPGVIAFELLTRKPALVQFRNLRLKKLE